MHLSKDQIKFPSPIYGASFKQVVKYIEKVARISFRPLYTGLVSNLNLYPLIQLLLHLVKFPSPIYGASFKLADYLGAGFIPNVSVPYIRG